MKSVSLCLKYLVPCAVRTLLPYRYIKATAKGPQLVCHFSTVQINRNIVCCRLMMIQTYSTKKYIANLPNLIIVATLEVPGHQQTRMMTSSNGNIFRVTGRLCREFFSPVPVNSPHKGQWRGALVFSLICVWINGWVNNREVGDLRRYRAHCDVTVMDNLHRFKFLLQHTMISHIIFRQITSFKMGDEISQNLVASSAVNMSLWQPPVITVTIKLASWQLLTTLGFQGPQLTCR